MLSISSERFADRRRTEDRIDRTLEELKRDRERNKKKCKENQKVINSLLEEIKFLQRAYETGIAAIGARCALRTGVSFRDAIKSLLEEHFLMRVERQRTVDHEGITFGRPDNIEADLIVKDGIQSL